MDCAPRNAGTPTSPSFPMVAISIIEPSSIVVSNDTTAVSGKYTVPIVVPGPSNGSLSSNAAGVSEGTRRWNSRAGSPSRIRLPPAPSARFTRGMTPPSGPFHAVQKPAGWLVVPSATVHILRAVAYQTTELGAPAGPAGAAARPRPPEPPDGGRRENDPWR